MKMRKLFLLGLISCVLFGQPCLAMEEDQRAVEVEEFDDLSLIDGEVEGRRKKLMPVNKLSVDLWGVIAGYSSTVSELVEMSLVSTKAYVGAHRSDPVLFVEFPEWRGEQERLTAFWVGFLDLAGKKEGEGLVSSTLPWNDHALWKRHAGISERLKSAAGYEENAAPNRVMLSVKFDDFTELESAKTLPLQLRKRICGLRLMAFPGTSGDVFSLFPNLEMVRLRCNDENPAVMDGLKGIRALRKLKLTESDTARDSQLNELYALEKLTLSDCSDVHGACFEGMKSLRILDVKRCFSRAYFDFDRLARLPLLAVLRVCDARELTDRHLDGLRLKELELYACPLVTGSCFEYEALQGSLRDKLLIEVSENLNISKIGKLTRLYSLELFFESEERNPSVSFEFLRNMLGLKCLECKLYDFRDEELLAFTGSDLVIAMHSGPTGSCFARMPNLEKVVLLHPDSFDGVELTVDEDLKDLIGEEFDISQPNPSKVVLRRKREKSGECFK